MFFNRVHVCYQTVNGYRSDTWTVRCSDFRIEWLKRIESVKWIKSNVHHGTAGKVEDVRNWDWGVCVCVYIRWKASERGRFIMHRPLGNRVASLSHTPIPSEPTVVQLNEFVSGGGDESPETYSSHLSRYGAARGCSGSTSVIRESRDARLSC